MIGKNYTPPDTPDPLRPTKYRPEYCQKIIEYFSVDPYSKHVDADGNHTGLPPKAPCIERFADSIGVVKSTLYEWAKRHKEFSNAISIARQKERVFVKDAGLASIYDSRFCNVVYQSIRDDSPNIHRCRTIRKKISKIQEALVNGDICDSKAEELKNLVLAEAQVTQISEMDERMRALERKERSKGDGNQGRD